MRARRRTLLAGAVGGFLLGDTAARSSPVKVPDHAGREVEIRDVSRLVTIGGDVTEIVYALGGNERLVAVDTTSLHPSEATRLPQVGYLRQLSAEGILSLRPSLIITTTIAGPAATLSQIRDAGVPILVLAEDHSFEGVLRKIETIGLALGREPQAAALAARKKAEMAAVAQGLAAVKEPPPRVLFLLAMGQGAPQASGVKTAADGIIRLARGRNAIESYQGYRALTAEGMLTAEPDVILVTSQMVTNLGGLDRVLKFEALQMTPAGRTKRIFALDALMLLGFGPRTPEAARQLAEYLYPGAAFPARP